MSFTWNGAAVDTIGAVLDTALTAMREGRAQEFLAAYSATTEHAAENLGYLFGYVDEATRRELYAAYPVSHPVFGRSY